MKSDMKSYTTHQTQAYIVWPPIEDLIFFWSVLHANISFTLTGVCNILKVLEIAIS